MIKKLIITLLVSIKLVSSLAYAQSIADIQVPKIVPPAPNAAALGKYGQIPVDKSTGIPSISIPLYEIKTSRLSLPISLSYHASGIRVDETASWVGIGWSLNAGGVVTRSIIGVADEAPNGYLNNTVPTAASIQFPRDSNYLENVAKGIQDSQPDNFFYNFGNYSGAFIFGQDKQPLLIPYKPLKVTYTPAPIPTPGSFTILDEQGNSYIFGDTEYTYSGASNESSGVSSWYLSKVISADLTDTIKFVYAQDATIHDDFSFSFTQNLGPYYNTSTGSVGGVQLWPMVPTINETSYQQIHLTGIQFKGGKVDFIPKSGRMDNGGVSLDSVIVSNYDYTLKKYSRVKSFKLLTDYFYSTLNNQPGYLSGDSSRYRLKLNGLSENDLNNTPVKTHQFDYNTTVLPPVHNFGQDTWGYYNGNSANQSLLQAQQIVSNNAVYTIGSGQGADRSVSSINMQAGVLQKITYPTRGYTVFNYESNQYLGPAITTYNPTASSEGYYSETSTTNYTPTDAALNTGGNAFHIHIVHNSSTANSYVRITRVSDGAVLYVAYANATTDQDFNIVLTTLASNVQYQLMAVSIGGSGSTPMALLPNSSIGTAYQLTNGYVTTNVGGLRVTSIQNYDSSGSILSTDTYKYGTGESGIGNFLSPSSLLINWSSHQFQFYIPEGASGFPTQTEDTYSNNSVYQLSSLSGSPVAYNQVTVYHGNNVQNIGKSIYTYTVTPDSILLLSTLLVDVKTIFPNIYTRSQDVKPIPRLWQNGEPITEIHYRNAGSGQYLMEQEKDTYYNLFSKPPGRGLSIQYMLEFMGKPRGAYSQFTNINMFIFYDYPILTGTRVPHLSITTNYDTDGLTVLTRDTSRTYYDNLAHVYPTRLVSYDGKGDSLISRVKYPQDMVTAGLDPTGIYAAMSAANIISPTIQFTKFKNGTQLMQSLTTYGSTNSIINPQNVALQVMANPAEVRLGYKYDNSGNLLTVNKQGGPPVSYQWGYKGLYPVAQASNAPGTDIFYDSFEEGDGNSAAGDAKTGSYSHTGTFTKTLTGLDAGAYTLSYWLKSGTSWALQSSAITVSGSTYTVSLASGQIDDVRFYPANAQMTTYTYAPLVGLTSTTDAKGETTYYEYDTFQRLQNIKDKDGNIIKSYCYNYAGQAIGCPVVTSAAIAPVITSLAYNGTHNALVTFTPIPNCTSAVINYTDQSSLVTSNSAGNGSSPATVVLNGTDSYSITVTCYSNAYPTGITSAAMVIGSNN